MMDIFKGTCKICGEPANTICRLCEDDMENTGIDVEEMLTTAEYSDDDIYKAIKESK